MFKRVYILVAVLVALFSCSKEGVEPVTPGSEGTVPLVFAPVGDWEPVNGVKSSGTKGLITNATELQGYNISLLGIAAKGGDTYPVFKNQLLSFSVGAWGYQPTKYWIKGAAYTFSAFCPFAGNVGGNGNISNGTVTISQSDTEPTITITGYNTAKRNGTDSRSEDLIFATVARDNRSTDDFSTVELSFQHLLSCITFNIRNTSNTAITSLTDISLEGLQSGCDIVITHNSITATHNSDADSEFLAENCTGSPFLPAGMAVGTYKPLFDCTHLTVLPQQVYGKDIVLNFTAHYGADDTVGTPYSLNLGGINTITSWVKGKKYSYNISISSKDIIFQVTEVPWKEHNVKL